MGGLIESEIYGGLYLLFPPICMTELQEQAHNAFGLELYRE